MWFSAFCLNYKLIGVQTCFIKYNFLFWINYSLVVFDVLGNKSNQIRGGDFKSLDICLVNNLKINLYQDQLLL